MEEKITVQPRSGLRGEISPPGDKSTSHQLTGQGIAVPKETDRISTTVSELRKLGAQVEELDDGMIIAGGSELKGGECQSYGDHRMAMSLAVAGLISRSGVTIHDVDCINTSFPGFWKMLSSLYT